MGIIIRNENEYSQFYLGNDILKSKFHKLTILSFSEITTMSNHEKIRVRIVFLHA